MDVCKSLFHSERHGLSLIGCWFPVPPHAGRERGLRSLFAGVAPRALRAGPSVGIVVSFYEVMKRVLEK